MSAANDKTLQKSYLKIGLSVRGQIARLLWQMGYGQPELEKPIRELLILAYSSHHQNTAQLEEWRFYSQHLNYAVESNLAQLKMDGVLSLQLHAQVW